MAGEIQRIDFHGHDLYTMKNEQTGKEYVLPKRFCEIFRLDWSGQRKKLLHNPLFKQGVEKISIPSASGDQETLILELDLLHAWLLSISPARVTEELQTTLLRYQGECAQALRDYWTKGAAINPRASDPNAAIARAKEQLGLLNDARTFLQADGTYDDLTKLTFAVQVKQLVGIADRTALPAASTPSEPPLWTVSMRLAHQGLLLHGAAYDTAVRHIGKRMAMAYRNTHQEDPPTLWDHVKGQLRPVKAYPPADLPTLDELIVAYREEIKHA